MKEYRCLICGYIYDDTVESVKFEDLPEDWRCPICGAPKDMFEEADDQGNYYKYQESLPIGLNRETGMYDYEIFIQTNLLLDGKTTFSLTFTYSNSLLASSTVTVKEIVEPASYFPSSIL